MHQEVAVFLKSRQRRGIISGVEKLKNRFGLRCVGPFFTLGAQLRQAYQAMADALRDIRLPGVGGAAQTSFNRKRGGATRLPPPRHRRLAGFPEFATDRDEATRRQFDRGVRVTELMKQKQYAPMSVAEMALSLYAVNNGFMDKVDRRKVVDFEAGLQSFFRTNFGELLRQINDKPELTREVEAGLKKCCEEFVAGATY